MIKEYSSVEKLEGPLLVVRGTTGVAYGELVQIKSPDGTLKNGQVLEVSEDISVVQVFEGTAGIDTKNTKVKFLCETLKIRVSKEMLGRVFNGLGKPIDGSPEVIGEKTLDIYGQPINPVSRQMPE